MAIRVEHLDGEIVVTLSGLDGLASGRRRLRIPEHHVAGARVAGRGALEEMIDHRVVGIGAHNAQRRPGRRRIGMMLGRDVVGNQFWAVPAGAPDRQVLVLDLDPPVGPFVRAVLDCNDAAVISDRFRA